MSAEDPIENTPTLSPGARFHRCALQVIRITTRRRTRGRRRVTTRQRAGYAEAIVGRAVALDIDLLAANLPRETSEQD